MNYWSKIQYAIITMLVNRILLFHTLNSVYQVMGNQHYPLILIESKSISKGILLVINYYGITPLLQVTFMLQDRASCEFFSILYPSGKIMS